MNDAERIESLFGELAPKIGGAELIQAVAREWYGEDWDRYDEWHTTPRSLVIDILKALARVRGDLPIGIDGCAP